MNNDVTIIYSDFVQSRNPGEIVKAPIRLHHSDPPTDDISTTNSNNSPTGDTTRDTPISDDRLTSIDHGKHGKHIHRQEDRLRNHHRRHRRRHDRENVEEEDGKGRKSERERNAGIQDRRLREDRRTLCAAKGHSKGG